MHDRRTFLQQTTLGLGGLCLTSSCANSPSQQSRSAAQHLPPRPNLVFILCDDLGYGDLSCYGHPTIQTPCLDALAQEGIRLTDCYAPAPVCSPSRAGAMTGRNPYRCEIPDWIPPNSPIHLQHRELSVASLLETAGYETAHYGKWHLNGTLDGSQLTPGDHGFSDWCSTQNNARPSHHNPDNFIRNGSAAGLREGYSSELIVDDAVEFLKQPRQQPFALFVWFHAPHEPIATGEPFVSMYSSVEERNRAIYYGNVSQMDHEVGRLVRTLDELVPKEDTLVMFTSDNGPETLNRYRGAERSYGSPGPLRGMKLHLYEGGIRVPGIIRWTGSGAPGDVCMEPVNGTDILPTFCELAGAEVPADRAIDGASFTPIFEGRSISRRRPLYWRYDRALSETKLAMRLGDWKILSDLNCERFELYNVREDRTECRDDAASDRRRVADMAQRLRAIHEEVKNDPISTSLM